MRSRSGANRVAGPGSRAVKVGMVPEPAVADALVRGLEGYAGPVVVDPVLAASSGGALWQGPLEALWPVLRRATLVTPNAPEAAALTGRPVETLADARAAAAALRAAGIAAVLIKGGHLGETADGRSPIYSCPPTVSTDSRARGAPGRAHGEPDARFRRQSPSSWRQAARWPRRLSARPSGSRPGSQAQSSATARVVWANAEGDARPEA